jgi:hypothetical protein
MDKDPGELQGLKVRVGLDIHGVIDTDPVFFADIAQVVRDRGGEVFIITGREDGVDLRRELEEYGMNSKLYNGILSITSYQKSRGTPVSYLDDRKSQPIMEPEVWNPTKAALCASAGIDVMIDDSALYETFFKDIKTQYIIYTPEIKEFLKILFYFGGYKL